MNRRSRARWWTWATWAALALSALVPGTASAAGRLTASDRLEIMELAARFEMALDREDVTAWLEVYTDDGVLEGFGPPARGKAQLRGAFDGMLNAFARGRRHCSTNQVVTGDGRTATMVSYLVVFNRNDLGRKGSAVVTDRAVKRNGTWFLAARKIEVDPSFGSDAPPGSASSPGH